ncbi:MAG: N-acetylglucosamine-6-phosphate deacetylase [Victivallaceae bacterium]|nr:N-acetylglucosamine-6-phosphate deacetylase [Victivallaceae bacterium]MDD4318656.1 N-acetylglucosamine-6-phosphate deacetylase [Victivallaceae bacterium]MDD5664474.1 N-acetylglucosamine-6-phosphate deacetylase [Victivallaceae bacterium]NLK83026.1 N-acetylglucosamine-6-phosphate deacetylase [Lentisphaerota bacterium]
MEKNLGVRKRTLFIADYCLTPLKVVDQCALLRDNERILAIGGVSAFTRDKDVDIYEFENAYITPGFIDSHIHGAGGFDSSRAVAQAGMFSAMSMTLVQRGVTSFVPTMVPDNRDTMIANLEALGRLCSEFQPGAEPLGIHMEGPFLNRLKAGSMVQNDIKEIDFGLVREFIAAASGKLIKMTFAPELEKSDKLVELLIENHILPSMGHSIADDKSTLRAIDAGARCVTHLFNGMPPLHQRDQSLTSVALTDERVAIELILDGMHLNPRMVDLACRCKPIDKVVGISDAIQAAGLPDGHYTLGATEIVVKNGTSRTTKGILAGTTQLLDRSWRELTSYSHMKDTSAAACVTMNPTATLNLHDRGILQPGKRADFAVFSKETNLPLMTVRRGEIVYNAGPENYLHTESVQEN